MLTHTHTPHTYTVHSVRENPTATHLATVHSLVQRVSDEEAQSHTTTNRRFRVACQM